MIHTINNQKLELKLTGTIGIVYDAQRMLGHTPQDGDISDSMAIYYCALKKNNPDIMSFEDFKDHMTAKKATRLGKDFWTQWNALEAEPDEDEVQEEQKDNGKGEE